MPRASVPKWYESASRTELPKKGDIDCDGEEAIGQTVGIAGDEKTMTEMVSLLSAKVGRSVRYVQMSEAEAGRFMPEEGLAMERWFAQRGYHVKIPALEERWGLRMTRLAECLKDAPWPPPRQWPPG